MKVLLIKDKKIDEKRSIAKGQIFLVRPVKHSNIFGGVSNYYQIIDIECPFSGEYLPSSLCIEQPMEKTFTESEVKAIENVHLAKIEHEKKFKEKVVELNKGLLKQINKKNDEIEKLNYCIGILGAALLKSCEALHNLKTLEKAK